MRDIVKITREKIEVVNNYQGDEKVWNPAVGNETTELLSNSGLSKENQNNIRKEAVTILSKCIPPTEASGQSTGLVVGYIQSGKTLSFTTVTALAHDNEYAMVIVIAGTSVPLTDQSTNRLRKDLRLESRRDRKWRHFHNPRVNHNSTRIITNLLEEWIDPDIEQAEKRTILITVMKHHSHLNHLINVLERCQLINIPVLIIDDEADQAGLNNLISEGRESTTYHMLRLLKESIPHHTFLQYTATPQGPLLINLIDVLSPGFAIPLNPGDDYVGGSDFFKGDSPFIVEIPQKEIPTRRNPLDEPPDSLIDAMHLFFIGVALGWIRDGGENNRSMMIHPSNRTIPHGRYYDWVMAIVQQWIDILHDNQSDDYRDLLIDFKIAYDNLSETVNNIESFEEIHGRLLHSIRRTEIHLVNAVRGKTPQIDWSAAYAHILIGGQALDRGFTVEGLTITYMPRGMGAGRADTIQQRARFFGYKRGYLGFCRIFIESQISDAFIRYVDHEQSIRTELESHLEANRPLQELRRIFLLTRALSPTRDSIIDVDYIRARINEGWYYPKSPHESTEAINSNLSIINSFISSGQFIPMDGNSERTEIQRHDVLIDYSLQDLYENLLLNLRFANLTDAQNFLGILVLLRNFLRRDSSAKCNVYNMSGGRPRTRGINQKNEIINLFQGAAPVEPEERRGEIYPGDRQIHHDDNITIQLHFLKIRELSDQNDIYSNVPEIAIWIPRDLASDVIIQDQGDLVENE